MYDEAIARKMLQEAVLISAEDAEDGRGGGRLRPERRGAGQVLPSPASWKQVRCFILQRRGMRGCAGTCLLWICIDGVGALPSDIGGQVSEPSPPISEA